MDKLLITINTSLIYDSITCNFQDDKIEEKSFQNFEDLSLLRIKPGSQVVLCIYINNKDHFNYLLETKKLESLNIPTIIILKEQCETMIKRLYERHFINIFFESGPEAHIKEKINYMFENYSFFTALQSKTVLNELNTAFFTQKEIAIIRLLAESPKKSLNRNTLYSKVWGGKSSNTNTLDVHLCNIRRKLKSSHLSISSLDEGKIALETIAS